MCMVFPVTFIIVDGLPTRVPPSINIDTFSLKYIFASIIFVAGGLPEGLALGAHSGPTALMRSRKRPGEGFRKAIDPSEAVK